MDNKKIILQIDISRKNQGLENRTKLVPIIETIILCGRQNFELRDDNDNGQIYEEIYETNDSNFRSLLRRKTLTDFVLSTHLNNSTSYIPYISSNIKNELININIRKYT